MANETPEIDLRAAVNAVSDVIQNRPRPLRDFDQIYMKAADMVLQSEFVARWASGKRLAFIGDGDAISVCVAYLQSRGIVGYGPSQVVVFDFDERIVSAIKRFADRERIEHLDAVLYNCLDTFPSVAEFDSFYTNPPWGKSNGGESVKLFSQRGMEAVGYAGAGLIALADDDELDWCDPVLANVQSFVLQSRFVVKRLMPLLHQYHLDDAPDLRSCNLIIRALRTSEAPRVVSCPVTDIARLAHFYGKDQPPTVKYVRERKRLDYGKASSEEYSLTLLEDQL